MPQGRWSRHRKGALVAWALTLACLSAGARAGAAARGRLGREVVPTSEALRLVVDPSHADYTGSAVIELDVKQPVRTFAFHARGITLDTLALAGAGGTVALTSRPRGEADLVDASAPAELAPGRYTLRVDFHNAFGTKGVGLYRAEVRGEGYAFTPSASPSAGSSTKAPPRPDRRAGRSP